METLQGMRLFTLAARSGSFSAAGRQVGLSPASMSRQIGSLETAMGARLMNRSSRHLSLTEAGKIFLAKATEILNQIDGLKTAVTEIDGESLGTLRVQANELLGRHIVLPIVSQFLARQPGIRLVLTFSDHHPNIVEKNIDISIRSSQRRKEEMLTLVRRGLGSYRRTLCASPAYIKKQGTPGSPSDLVNHYCLTYQVDMSPPDTSPPVWQFRSGSNIESIAIGSRVHCHDGDVLRSLAVQGYGIAMLPSWAVFGDVQSGRLLQLLPKYEAAPSGFSFETPVFAFYQRAKDRSQSRKLRKFLELLVASLQKGKPPGWGNQN
jgi:DNA-binding transcriptional LysR family regulator